MNGVYLLLGTNLGERLSNLSLACRLLSEGGCMIEAKSRVYETAAWGITEQPSFLNQVLKADTTLSPEDLLALLLRTEQEMGRIRHVKWGERLIDIDILYYHDVVQESTDLHIPHPQIQNRRFTLVPMVELAADEIHPTLQKTQAELLEGCPDDLEVTVYQKPAVK